MLHRLCVVVFAVLISSGSFAATIRPTGASVPGEVLVRIEAAASKADVEGIQHAADVDRSDRIAKLKSGAIWRMHSRSKNTDAILKALEKNPNVTYVEPNFILHASATANDPSYTQLWGLKNTGQTINGVAGLTGADIDAESAWNLTTGSASIVVGVVDTGVDYNHPDLAANMWSNPGGIGDPGCAAGTHGFNAITKTCDPMDDHYHGTHVSGTIGAAGNNGVGVTGVNWTTSIMALKFLNSYGSGTTADAISAIDFAVQAKIAGVNVRVLSNSWGGGSFSRALFDEINKANENDILFVAAAGNGGYSTDLYSTYPASYATANMISVAATDNRDALAYFSNYGATSVHLGAPGVSVFSSSSNNSYTSLSGTSMATPHVAGVAALLLAHSPSLTTAQVKSAILNNVDPIESLAGKTVTGGRLNAARTLGLPATPDFAFAISPTSRTIARGSTASYDITITPSNGFSGAVTFSATGLPSDATATFTPNPATTSSTLTVTTTGTTITDFYGINVTGTGGAEAHARTVYMTVLATLPPPVCPNFGAQIKYSFAYDPTFAATGDFNRDGKPDLAVTSTSTNRIVVYLGSGIGTLQSATQYEVGNNPLSVAVGDFNGDGRADLASANSGSHNVSIRLGNGDGTFQAAVAFAAGMNPFSIASGDFDADGNTDLAVANNGSNNVSILLGEGDGTFQAAVPYATGSGAFWVAVGDLNRDGRPDLAVAAHNGDEVSVLLGNGDGTFQTAVDYATGDGPSSVVLADLDADGNPDLAVATYSANNVAILAGNGDGTFQAAIPYAVGNRPYAVAALDANGDGVIDLVTANSASNTVSLLSGLGNGTFQAAVHYPVGNGPNHVAVADFNRDGRPDLAVPNVEADPYYYYDSISILLNSGTCSMNCGAFGAPGDLGVGTTPESVAAGDFNRDGELDVAVANSGSDNVSVTLGNGDGTFAVAVDYGAGDAPQSIKAADVNRDGKLDLVTANAGSDNVTILLGNGDGTFQGAISSAAGDSPQSVAVGDFNRDADLDLAVANELSDNASILLGNGDGTFQAAVDYAAGDAPKSVAIGDLDNNGISDLGVANAGSSNVSILRGKVDGTFNAATSYAAGTTPSAIFIGDLNRDGKADLAVANSGSSDVSLLPGNGNGSVQSAVHYGAGTNPDDVTAADFNADGILDLAVANRGSNDVSVLYGTGNGTFTPATSLGSGTDASGLTVGDFNRDGKPDLAIANAGSNALTIVLDQCPVPDLTVTKTHTGDFTQGDTGKTYTITVTNSGAGPTDGAVSVTDTLPFGLTATAMTGSGWTCSHLTVSCTRNDVLAAGASYPPVTLTVKVSSSTPSSVTNTVTVAGGYELNTLNSSASDPTTIIPITDLTITKTHPGSFAQGATGKTYTITVRNAGGVPSAGTVTVTDALPAGLTATAISGTGWTCTLGSLSCTRSDVLGSGSNYPAIMVTVNVAANASTQVVNTATVSGGGDSIVTNNTASDTTTVWSSQTCGGFGVAVNYPVPSSPYRIAMGDFDNDGTTDLATAAYYGGVSVLRGNGNGTFTAAVNYQAGSEPRAIVATDLNNDGNDDLAVANYYSNTISVLLAYGDGTFAAAAHYATASYPFSMVTGDFNADGNPDVAVTHGAGTGGISVLLGTGNGTLQAAVNRSASTVPRAVVTADFDGDGKLDLVVTNSSASSISTFKGNGDGTFQTAVNMTVGSESGAIAAGDFNADGKVDLVVSRNYSYEILVLIGNGDGTFQPPVIYDTGYSYNSDISIEDLNGDGVSDILVTTSSSSLFVLTGNGDGTFEDPSYQYLGFYPGRLVVSDFNGDGKPDLAATNNSSAISVLLGGCADLTIDKSHVGNFRAGQSGTYSLKVTNSGTGSSSGTVTLTDVLPTGLTANYIYGSGWDCTTATLTCTTNYSIAAGASYSTVTLYVNVSNSAPTSLINTATVSGGSELNTANNSDSDPTTIVHGPDLTITMYNSGSFGQGFTGRAYSLYVNNLGNQSTSGTVTVTDTLPPGLTPTAISGTGWDCSLNTLTCTRNDALFSNGGYPQITVTVDVDANCPSQALNVATISGGGDADSTNNTASNETIVLAKPTNVVATAISASEIQLTWSSLPNADYYYILRSSDGSAYSYRGTAYSTNSYVDSSVTADKTYLYIVRGYSWGPMSAPDAATTIVFTDATIQAGVTTIKKAHLTELRTAVNAVRASAVLPAATFTDPDLTGTVPFKAIHVSELRTALNAARSVLGLPVIAYVDPDLSTGMPVKAAHFNDLRLGVK